MNSCSCLQILLIFNLVAMWRLKSADIKISKKERLLMGHWFCWSVIYSIKNADVENITLAIDGILDGGEKECYDSDISSYKYW